MFNRTRIQLTIRNAAVLGVILIALNMSVYWLMKGMLFARVDRSLMKLIEVRSAVSSALSPSPFPQVILESGTALQGVVFSLNRTDRPIIRLYWTDDLKPIPIPGGEAFTEEQLKLLNPQRFGNKPKTVQLGDQHFRVLKVQPANFTVARGDRITPIAYQQLLSNVTAEIDMLRRLAYILLIGGFVGLMIAVAAGFYLANRALVPIRRSMEQQQQFVSDASHELRTPLSVIQAHAELMLRHPERTIEEDSRHVSTVLQEARRMSKLVGSLLTLARSDAGQLELDRKPVQLDKVMQECADKMRMLAEVKNLIIQTEMDAQIIMQADEERLHQLFIIVLDNAIKYTPEGGLIRIACRKFAHTAHIEIEDTGIGIAPEQLPRIFDRFYRIDEARTRQDGGVGLGLAIAQWIVQRHGGKIRVESKLSAGTTVFISLPL